MCLPEGGGGWSRLEAWLEAQREEGSRASASRQLVLSQKLVEKHPQGPLTGVAHLVGQHPAK